MSSESTPLTSWLDHPVVQAPMAGGPSCPELAAAVCGAGGLGFLAAGFNSPDAMREEIGRLRELTDRPFGVNLFVPQPAGGPETEAAVAAYRDRLAGEAARYGTELGDPGPGGHDGAAGYEAKLAALLDDPVPFVSFTFGCPPRDVLAELAGRGTLTAVTVTSVAEARAAREAGADVLCVQGIEAGGHQSTHRDDPAADGPGAGIGLLTLLALVRDAVPLPLIAAGGLMRGEQIAAVLAAGATAAQLGTAFLACPESGAHELHKRALTDVAFPRTELTRAFTGRPARGLVNRFMAEHGAHAPAAYPQVQRLTTPLRRAAVAAGDAQALPLWAGQGHRLARPLPAAELVAVLAGELAAARAALASAPSGRSA
ncbi:nitronate monooxygenase [Streptomyces sp. TRM43335]|uniref:Probable nitronate monooxygenase n=1 Tax=Streptomyces taklimakanensis TaxID=2569853 RepID=A0A6G2B9R6_9ACTN|nr:nitronate monooxygenase [Streptomyces taklimakanensis]MTE18998.1 nitronate monooxygenase [Streptomyces taklimakanensis]